jgi:multiple antibiotic resistance protein
LNEFINSVLLVFAGLFPIVNPVGDAPIFLTLTRHSSLAERHSLASKVAVNSFILLTCSLFLGSYVLEFFGITLPVLRIAGGLVVTAFGWKLLHTGDNPDETDNEKTAGKQIDAFYPLTMPLTVGPGSISVAIALGSQRPPAGQEAVTALATLGLAAVLGVAAIAVSIYVCYRFAETIVSVLGPRGTDVVMRLSAFILLCIGIQIMWAGYSSLMHPVH